MIDDYRRVIVLMSEPALSEADAERERMVGRVLFFRNQSRAQTLTQLASNDPATIARLLDWLESDADLRDADKLAFLETLSELDAQADTPLSPDLAARLHDDLAAVRQIQVTYAAEVRAILAKLGTRGMQLKRES